ncbi:MAG: hypothetical protein OHK0052_15520 [Anaerolineales bacterium]
MKPTLRWYDAIPINIYYLGLTTLAQTTTPLILPLLVQQFVGAEQQGDYYGNLRLWMLMTAVLVQAFMGLLSDHSRLPWGRRRPFIVIGTLLTLACLVGIGFTANLQGFSGYYVLLIVTLLMMFSINIAHAAQQSLIPDLVPETQRGRFSGIKALMEVPLPLILVSLVVAPLVGRGNLWGGLGIAMGALTFGMLVSLWVRETPLTETTPPLDWKPFSRLAIMTGAFTAIILGSGSIVRLIGSALAYTTRTAALFWMGSIGLITMSAAIGLGVWLSVRIAFGSETRNHHAFGWWVVNRLAFLVGSTNLASFIVYFLQSRLQYDGEQAAGPAGQMLLVIGLAILVTAPPGGWLADRFGNRFMVMLSGLLAALGVLIAISIPNLTVIFIGALLIGVGTGIFYSANWALGTTLVPREQAGRYLGVANLAGAGAGAVGAYIGGPIADLFTRNFPNQAGLGYVLLFGLYGVMFLLSIAALSRVKTH